MHRSRALLLGGALFFGGCELIGGIDDRQVIPGGGGGGGESGDGGGLSCGVPAYDCLGGECYEGACQPVLVTPVAFPNALAVSGPRIYWSANAAASAEVRYCNKAGCDGEPTVFLDGLTDILNLVATPENLFILKTSVPGAIVGCPITATSCSDYTFSATPLHGPTTLAVDSGFAYFSTLGDKQDTEATWLYSCPTFDCTKPTPLVTTRASAIAFEGQFIYWVDEVSHHVRRCHVGGCANTEQTVTAIPNATGFDLYVRDGWVTYAGSGKNLYRCELTAAGTCGPLITVAETAEGIAAFDIDESFAYFAERSKDPQPIRRAALTGEWGDELASGEIDVIDLVQDDAAVYWVAAGERKMGSLRKVAKPPQ